MILANKRQVMIARRVVVLVGLLCLPTVLQYLWFVSFKLQSIKFLKDHGAGIAYFTWGMSKSYPLIGVWLVSRDRLFHSFYGCLRAIIYLTAANYGWVCGLVFQDWLHSNSQSMPIPGTHPEHFGLAALLSIEVMAYAWLFWPMLYFFRRRLTDREMKTAEIARLSIRFLLVWTAFAALILTSVRLLAMHGEPLHVGIASGSVVTAMTDLVAKMPLQVIHLMSIAVIMIGLAGSPKYWIFGLMIAVVVQFAGEQIVFWATSFMRDPRSLYGVMADPWKTRLPYFAGTIVVSFGVFVFARISGLAFRHAGGNQNGKVGDEGLEPPSKTSGKIAKAVRGGAKSGALGNGGGLDEVAAAWPALPTEAKTGILGIVRAIRCSGERIA